MLKTLFFFGFKHKLVHISVLKTHSMRENFSSYSGTGEKNKMYSKPLFNLLFHFIQDELYVGPLEFQVKTLQRQIKSKGSECLELQQYWLRQQNELVKVIQEAHEQATEIDIKKKQSTILLQKKLRIEGKVEHGDFIGFQFWQHVY